MNRKKLAEKAEKVGGCIPRLEKRVAEAEEGPKARATRKALKRAQRKKRRLEVEAQGGKNAAEAAAKAAAAAS